MLSSPQKKNPAANGASNFRHFNSNKNAPSHQPDLKSAMGAFGIFTDDPIIEDGKIHRVHAKGDKAGSKNVWYILFAGSFFSGAFGCWKRGISQTWCAKPNWEMTQEQREQNRSRMAEAKKIQEAEEAKRHAVARRKALFVWGLSLPEKGNHPYLEKKGVKSHGLRAYKEALVIPLRDTGGKLHNLQFIDGEGNKRFLAGGRKKGCYFSIGVPQDTLCIAEGYATASSIYESTGFATAVAFDAGNLLSVSQVLRAKFPLIKIILCADNDFNTLGNPGLKYAKIAAKAIHGHLAIAGDII